MATQDLEKILRGTHGTYKADPDVVFFFYSDVDTVGHQYGFDPSVPQYLAEIADTDQKIGRALDSIAARSTFASEDWLIVVTSDHGGSKDGSHHGNTAEKRRIPFIVSGRSAAKTKLDRVAKNVDVSKTVLAFMGVPVAPAWNLDGHVVGLKSIAPILPNLQRDYVRNGDFEFDRGFEGTLPDQYVSFWDDPGPDMTTVVRYGAPGFPGLESPGPTDRGANFCCGGNQAAATLNKSIDLSAVGPNIDSGAVYRVSAWLGGYDSQADEAKLVVRFLASDGALKGTVALGPVTPSQRGNVTGLLIRQAAGNIPVGTRKAELKLSFTRYSGAANDGYADNVAFVIDWH